MGNTGVDVLAFVVAWFREIRRAQQDTEQQADAIRRSAEVTRKRLRDAVRPPGKRFRLDRP